MEEINVFVIGTLASTRLIHVANLPVSMMRLHPSLRATIKGRCTSAFEVWCSLLIIYKFVFYFHRHSQLITKVKYDKPSRNIVQYDWTLYIMKRTRVIGVASYSLLSAQSLCYNFIKITLNEKRRH
jgi:hypothetical protein